jgi:hypothetical protein
MLNFVFLFCGRSGWFAVGDVVIIVGAGVKITVSIRYEESSRNRVNLDLRGGIDGTGGGFDSVKDFDN